MTAKEQAILTMFRNTALTCREHEVILKLVPAFERCANVLAGNIAAITSLATSIEQMAKGAGSDKQASLQTATTMGQDIAGMISAYASNTGKAKLKVLMDAAQSDLKRSKSETILAKLNLVVQTAQEHAKDLTDYRVTPALLEVLTMAINNFTSQSTQPQYDKKLRSTYTQRFKRLISETLRLFKAEMDKMIVGYKNDHPDFVGKYLAARKVYDPPTQRTQIRGHVQVGDTEQPVKKAEVTITGPVTLTTLTSSAGHFLFKPIPVGTYTITVKADGFADAKVEEVAVKLGKVTRELVLVNSE